MSYPVNVHVDPLLTGRNRMTVGFRPILAIPHAVLTGPVYFWFRSGTVGLLGGVAYFLALVSWFTLLFDGKQLAGVRDFSQFYLRWRARSLGYMTLLTDRYPPFGDGVYPIRIEIHEPDQPRDRLTIAFRCVLAVPHLVTVCFLGIASCVIAAVSWFAILFTGSHPEPLYSFSEGMLRWVIRVEAYMLLLVDEYPPFSLT